MSKLRRVAPLTLPKLEFSPVKGNAPACIMVAPADLHIESEYQRDLSDKSIALIRKIASHWNWAHVKPPIVVKDDGKLMVIDGQHTAIAAATRGDIEKIPVMLVDGCDIVARADAFVAHNTLKVQVTSTQIYYSRLAAGDQIAVLVAQACKRSGVTILRQPPSHGIFKTGETMAVAMLRRFVEKKGAAGLTRILKILVAANRQIKATELAAVFMLLYSNKFGQVDDADLTSAIGLKSITGWETAVAKIREQHKKSLSMALAERWIKEIQARVAA